MRIGASLANLLDGAHTELTVLLPCFDLQMMNDFEQVVLPPGVHVAREMRGRVCVCRLPKELEAKSDEWAFFVE